VDTSKKKSYSEVRQHFEDIDLPPRQREMLINLLGAVSSTLEKELYPEKRDEAILKLMGDLMSYERLLAVVMQQADELEALKKISVHLTSSLDLKKVLHAVVEEAMRLLDNAFAAHIFLYDKDKDKLHFGSALQSDGTRNVPFAEPRPNGLTATVARTGQAIIVPNMGLHPLYINTPDHWRGSIISLPIKVDDNVVGVMNLSRSQPGEFSEGQLRLITVLVDHAAVAIENARLHELVSQQAKVDILTGLPNRRALDEQLEAEVRRASRSGKPFSVVMMDLDGFKRINDTYGHEVGDVILRQAFGMLNENIRVTDFLARYGGDELTLILPETDIEPAVLAVTKLQHRLSRLLIQLPDGNEISMSISGGIAQYPLHGKTAADLLRAADAALYRAKKYQRGTILKARGPTDRLPISSIIAEA
jgi:diguanylate cyclase (GGDEF)-like protein